ncbi:MAG: hypothetical protein WC707_04895 [Candidatus Babeliaceae bacterium]|jgi:hypothetical protein
MFSKKNIIMFFAGAEAFHTLAHIVVSRAGMLPIKFFSILWTQNMNLTWGILFNGVITIGLLYWASQLKK